MEDMIIQGDSAEVLKSLPANSVDIIVTDPPYGYSFMGKDWDKAVPSVEIWKECLRVLKPGAFAFIMSAPRSDVLSRMIVRIEDAGFRVDFTPIYWTYASGFPKAMNIGKMVDKRGGQANVAERFTTWMRTTSLTAKQLNEATGTFMGSHYLTTGSQPALPTVALWNKIKPLITVEIPSWVDDLIDREEAEREILATRTKARAEGQNSALPTVGARTKYIEVHDTAPATDAAKALDGSYGGFQPKPAVEVVIVAMKPLSEKTYVDQALKNGKGCTWLDKCRIGTEHRTNTSASASAIFGTAMQKGPESQCVGRFPANLLVESEVLGDHSRFFSLDEWANTLPFLIVPKAAKSEKNAGPERMEERQVTGGGGLTAELRDDGSLETASAGGKYGSVKAKQSNFHPTVKPLKLMSYLITLGSRKGDKVLDPFAGSGTTLCAAKALGRKYIGIELQPEYVEIAQARIAATDPPKPQLFEAAE